MADKATLQIATFGGESQEGIATGIKNFSVHKLVLLCYNSDKQDADEFAKKYGRASGLPITIALVEKESIVRDAMERVSEIMSLHNGSLWQVLMNVSSGDRTLGCAALAAAFVNGIKAFGVDATGAPMPLPVLKVSCSEIISDAKLRILQAINRIGGRVESLERLEQASGYGKPLLSYHVMGTRGSKGLADMGLVDIEKGKHGRISAKLTTLGKLLVTNNTAPTLA